MQQQYTIDWLKSVHALTDGICIVTWRVARLLCDSTTLYYYYYYYYYYDSSILRKGKGFP